MLGRWTPFITRLRADRRVRVVALTLYYLAIQAGLFALHRKGDVAAPDFIYQGF